MAEIGRKGGAVCSQAKRDAAKLRAKAQWARRNRRNVLQPEKTVSTNEINGALAVVTIPDATVKVSDSEHVNR